MRVVQILNKVEILHSIKVIKLNVPKFKNINFETILKRPNQSKARADRISVYHQLQIHTFHHIATMSYLPLPTSQTSSKQQQLKHRNPIFKQLKYPRPQPIHTLQSQITSSLFFQQLLYYNSFYLAIFSFLYLASQVQRFMYFKYEYGVPVRIIVFAIFVALDICRLQNGYHGNLKQSFPEICAFLMLTIFTIGGQVILLAGIVPYSPLQWSVLFYGAIFHCLQFLVCLCTMSRLTQTQKALFLWRNPLNQSKN